VELIRVLTEGYPGWTGKFTLSSAVDRRPRGSGPRWTENGSVASRIPMERKDVWITFRDHALILERRFQ
jgi:hypothetical protein